MKINLDCIPCFQRQALQSARFATNDVELQEKILRRVIDNLLWMDWSSTPPEMANSIHRIVKEECNVRDPYKKVKKECNDLVLELYPGLRKNVNSSEDSLLTAVRLAIAGNIMDFGAMSEFDIEKTVSRVIESDFAINDYQNLVESLENSRTIVYIADNAGEIVFDKLLLETILGRYKIEGIQFAVKGAPVINDATLDDAKYVGVDKIPGVKFIEVATGEPDTGVERNSKEFLEILDSADVVISKGQGNYEALSSHVGIFFLLMAKCPVVAEDLGVDEGDIILRGT